MVKNVERRKEQIAGKRKSRPSSGSVMLKGSMFLSALTVYLVLIISSLAIFARDVYTQDKSAAWIVSEAVVITIGIGLLYFTSSKVLRAVSGIKSDEDFGSDDGSNDMFKYLGKATLVETKIESSSIEKDYELVRIKFYSKTCDGEILIKDYKCPGWINVMWEELEKSRKDVCDVSKIKQWKDHLILGVYVQRR